MTLQFGWENEDFMLNRHTILVTHENLKVVFKVNDKSLYSINDDLYYRLILYKAKKRLSRAIKSYPLGGIIRYAF